MNLIDVNVRTVDAVLIVRKIDLMYISYDQKHIKNMVEINQTRMCGIKWWKVKETFVVTLI